MIIFKKALKTIQSRLSAAYGSLDVRDIFFMSGMALLGYGLWLIQPWLMFVVIGVLFMAISLMLGRKEAK